MNGTYFEGSQKGNLWLRDINYEHEKLMKIPNDFTDKIKRMHYNSDKNLVFVSCRDGRFKCWKLPNAWFNPNMEQIRNDIDFKLRVEMSLKG